MSNPTRLFMPLVILLAVSGVAQWKIGMLCSLILLFYAATESAFALGRLIKRRIRPDPSPLRQWDGET